MNEVIDLNDQEIWLPVIGYEKFYSVSSFGRIRSEERKVIRKAGNNYITKTRIMKPARGKKIPYLSLRLTNEFGTKASYVHHLVLNAFIGKKPEGKDACHCDGNSQNNRKENLRWDTKKSNHADKNIHNTSTIGERHHGAKLSNKSVSELRNRRLEGASFTDLANEFGITRMTAHRAATGKSWSHIK